MKDFFRNKRVAVTGAGGFIGSRLTQELVLRGAKVNALLDEGSIERRLNSLASRIHIRHIPAWKEAVLKPVLQNIRPQIVFHLRAAINQVPGRTGKEHFFQVNVEDTKELAKAALGLELEAFVNAGTTAEYGAAASPFKEDEEAKPISEYGESKLAATVWLKSFYEQHGFPAVLVRSSVVYGPGQKPHSYLIPNVIMSCIMGEDFRITSSGLQTRDPLFISDDVNGLLMAASIPKARGHIINLGLGREYTVLAIARRINRQLGHPIAITTGSDIDRPRENEHYWQDISKAKKLLNWAPKVSLEKGINETVSWYQEHYQDFVMIKKKNVNVRVPYALAVFGKEERKAVEKVLATPMIVPGPYARKFEQKISRLFGKRYGVLVNSGSSANLLAFEVLNLPKGSEVITPALTFGTTLAPIIQKGLTPVFVDIVLGDYTVDVAQVESMITKKTKALMIPSLIGNISDYRALSRLAKKHKLYLIEDSCDTLGARLYGKPTGYYSDISTTSFYASHIVTAAGSGGMICVNNPEWYKRAKTLAGWGRSSAVNESERLKHRFGVKLAGIPYDRKFLFTEIGYNFQSTDIAAAFGLAQLKKFGAFFRARERNFKALIGFFKAYEQFFILPRQNPNAKTAWLAFPLVVRPGAPFTRRSLVTFLEERNIQTRPMFTGNVLRQPAFKGMKARVRAGGYLNADVVMRGSLLIGCHQGIGPKHLAHVKNVFSEFLDK